MAYSEKNLFNNEKVVVEKYPHWIYLAPRALILMVASALGILALLFRVDNNSITVVLRAAAGLLVLGSLLFFLGRLIGWRATQFIVTTERCIYRAGVLKKTGIEIPLDRISTVFFSQTFLERLVQAGDLGIESAGEGSRQNFSDISDPVGEQNLIYPEMERHENRKFDRIGSEAREGFTGAQPAATLSVAEQIEKLADLRDRGAISAEEYETHKNQLLG